MENQEENPLQVLINNLEPQELQQLLFSLLYLANRPVFFDEINPIFKINSLEEFEERVIPLIDILNDELHSRSAPYFITINFDNHTVSLDLKPEYLEKIKFSNYIFSTNTQKISRNKMKILSYITYKTIIRHSFVSLDEIIKKYGVSGLNQANELEKAGFIYQNRITNQENNKKIVTYELTNRFFDLMNFPKEPFELSGYLRKQFLSYFNEEEEEEEEEENDE